MKLSIITLVVFLPCLSYSEICSVNTTEKKVLTAATSIEKINMGGHPLKTEVISYSSKEYTWSVIFSYSGLQNIWTVRTSDDGCFIQSIYK